MSNCSYFGQNQRPSKEEAEMRLGREIWVRSKVLPRRPPGVTLLLGNWEFKQGRGLRRGLPGQWIIIREPICIPEATVTNGQKLSGLKQQFVLWESWGQKSEPSCGQCCCPFWCSRAENISCFFHLPLATALHYLSLWLHCPFLFSLYASLCLCQSLLYLFMWLYLDPTWIIQDKLLLSRSLTESHLQRPFFQLRCLGLGPGPIFWAKVRPIEEYQADINILQI